MSREETIRELRERYRQEAGSLNERQRRQWAAAEAKKLGRGGITLVCEALRMSPNTVRRGLREADETDGESASDSSARIRRAGGGRKLSRPSPEDA